MNLILTLKQRLLLLLCIFVIAFFILSLISGLVAWKFGMSTPAVRIITILQDIILFILPAVGTALVVTRQPATLMCLDKAPEAKMIILAVLTLLVALPAMNFVIWLNLHLPLPDQLANILKGLEEQAESTVEALYGRHDIANLIVTVLIVGVFAGLSEELLFRGGLQRLLVTGGVNVHTAIWVTAIFFSLMHMQFYGFVPRMLLGAYFGYLLYWSKSLWVPIILHVFNNTLYVAAQYLNYGNEEPSALDSFGHGSDYIYVVLSVIATAFLLRYMWSVCVKRLDYK